MSGFHEECQEEFLRKQVETWIQTDFGPRCDTFEKSCIVCQKWKALDELFDGLTTAAVEDPWVTQDRVPARTGVDEYRYASWLNEPDRWRPVNESGGWDGYEMHGWKDRDGDTLLLRCRLSQLPERGEVTDRRGVVLTPWQKVFVLQKEQTRIATVVRVTDSRSSNGWWVDVDFGDRAQVVPSDILEVCNAPSEPADQPDPDEWVVQDRVPMRPVVDEGRFDVGDPEPDRRWHTLDKMHKNCIRKKHGDVSDCDDILKLHVRCRRRDLPPVDEPEQWPKYWTTCDATEFAYVEQVDDFSAKYVRKDGSHIVAQWGMAELRKQLTEAEAMALLKKPQPAKTLVRLFVNPAIGQITTYESHADTRGWQEIHHDAEGFYVEGK